MNISIVTSVLSDRSKVYDVIIHAETGIIRLPCVTKADADALACGMAGLIEAHTNEEVTI